MVCIGVMTAPVMALTRSPSIGISRRVMKRTIPTPSPPSSLSACICGCGLISRRPRRGEECAQVAHQAWTLPCLRERRKIAFRPEFDIVDQEMFQHGTVALAPLGQWHFQHAFQLRGHALALVWIDD